MSIQTTDSLQPATIEKLQTLIRYNIDSYDGFRQAADQVTDSRLAELFRAIGQQRSNLATELQQHVEFEGAEAEDDGSVKAAVHRTWLTIRGKLSTDDAVSVLKESERGEEYIKSAYEDVLKDTAGNPLNSVLLEQYKVVKNGHDQIVELRRTFENAS